MRISRLLTVVVALAVLIGVLGGARALANIDPRLLRDAHFGDAEITPNADGHNDATPIEYSLNRNAWVSIYFVDSTGQKYYFRNHERRSATRDTPYRVLFSGVVDGFTRLGEHITGQVEARVLPDGDYTWVIEATDDSSHSEQATGKLSIRDADTKLPQLLGFTVYPKLFTPNQDGIDDRVQINYSLTKDVDPEWPQVYLVGKNGQRTFIPEQQELNAPGHAGLHTYNWSAGVDQGAPPPPDGDYTILAEVADRVGQRTQVTTSVQIQDGGVPQAYIVPQPDGRSVQWSSLSVVLGNTVYFTVTVENNGKVPIRTTGPAPGTVFNSDQNFATLGWTEESGAWRVGINCDTCQRDYPWRWAVGSDAELVTVNGQKYLLPGHRAVVTGGIRLVSVNDKRNPQYFWAGLIHEDVEISTFNNHVDPQQIDIIKP